MSAGSASTRAVATHRASRSDSSTSQVATPTSQTAMREAAPMPAEGTTVNETVGGPIPPPSITIGTSEQTEEAIMAAAIAATTEVAIALPTTAATLHSPAVTVSGQRQVGPVTAIISRASIRATISLGRAACAALGVDHTHPSSRPTRLLTKIETIKRQLLNTQNDEFYMVSR